MEKKEVGILSLQLVLLEIEKSSLITNKSIEEHFERKFDDYFDLLQDEAFWQSVLDFSEKN